MTTFRFPKLGFVAFAFLGQLISSVKAEPPGYGDSLKVWLKADTLSGSTGTSVTTWTDSSGYNNHASQATVSAKPTLVLPDTILGVEYGLNTQPVLSFDGNDSMSISYQEGRDALSEMHVFIVARVTAPNSNAPMLSTGYQNGWIIRYNNNVLEYVHPNGGTPVPLVTMTGYPGWQVIEVEKRGTSIYLRIDGKEAGIQTLTSFVASTQSNTTIGKYAGTDLGGDIAEIMVYETALGSADRDTVRGYLAQKYNRALRYAPKPSVTITAPQNQVEVGQTDTLPITLRAFSNDSNPLEKAEFFANNIKIGEATATTGAGASGAIWAPTLNWNVNIVGPIELKAKVTKLHNPPQIPPDSFESPILHIEAINRPPEISVNPVATPNPTRIANTSLTVTATDDLSVSQLTYHWSYSGSDPNLPIPTFSVNNSNAAKTTSIAFAKIGQYPVRVEVRDSQGGTVMSDNYTVTVEPSASYFEVVPQVANLTYGVQQKFKITGMFDQFSNPYDGEAPLLLWGLSTSTAATIGATTGLFTAGTTTTGPITVTATKAHYVSNGGVSPDFPSVTDTAEVYITAPPASLDTDRDGLTDAYEIANSYPGPKYTSVNLFDSDFDGISDGWEVSHSLNPTSSADAQLPFGNGLTNVQEYRRQTTLVATDANGDGLYDSIAIALGRDPNTLDSDGDGLTNTQEILAGTHPFGSDSDGDGVSDFSDFYPLDPTRSAAPPPVAGDTTGPTVTLTAPTGATLN